MDHPTDPSRTPWRDPQRWVRGHLRLGEPPDREPEPQETPEELEAMARQPIRHALWVLAVSVVFFGINLFVPLTVWLKVSNPAAIVVALGVGTVVGVCAAAGDLIRARGFTHPGGLASRAVHLYRLAAGDPREFKINKRE